MLDSARDRRRLTIALKRAAEALARPDLSSPDSPELTDTFAKLRRLVEQMQQALAGEFRIMAIGENGSHKSTTLRRLVGLRDTLPVGPGAVTAAPTELRLTPVDTDPRPPVWRAYTLTEAAARRRALRLLELPAEDPRRLDELAQEIHPAAPMVKAMLRTGRTLGFGGVYDRDEYELAGGKVEFGKGGGEALLDRQRIDVDVPRAQWPLDWARGRTVVLLDLPGTRDGGALEKVVAEEMQDSAHVALLHVKVTVASLNVPDVSDTTDCVLLVTEIEADGGTRHRGAVEVRETAVAHQLDMLRESPSRSVDLALLVAPWEMPKEEWEEFDGEAPHLWTSLDDKRKAWLDAVWPQPSPTGGALQEAVAGAAAGNGTARLQMILERLGRKERGAADLQELQRLVDRARDLITEGREFLLAHEDEARVGNPLTDPQPITELRQLAADCADERVYGHLAWSETARHFRMGEAFVVPAPVCDDLGSIAFGAVAADAAQDLHEELGYALEEWWTSYPDSPSYPAPDEVPFTEADADQFARLADRLLHQLAGRPDTDYPDARPSPICFREVARVREEVARLLQRRLVDVFSPRLDSVQHALAEAHARQGLPQSHAAEVLNLVDHALPTAVPGT